MSPYERFVASAYDHGGRSALHVAGAHVTYEALLRRATAVRHALDLHGVGPGARVGICGPASDVGTYAAVLGTLGTGAAYVALGPPPRRGWVAEVAGLAALCAVADPAARELAVSLHVPFVDVATLDACSADWSLPAVDDADLLYVLPTSGSTGHPKLVPITLGNVRAFLAAAVGSSDYALTPDDRLLQMFDPTFDLWVPSLFVSLAVGACSYVISADAPAPAAVLGALGRHQLTFALMVPSVLAYLKSELGTLRLPALRYSQFCGEALRRDLLAAWQPCVPNARIENLYGPTEATVYCSRYVWDPRRSPAECDNGIVPIGLPTRGNVLALLETGELVIAGPQVMPGYLGASAELPSPFVTIEHEAVSTRAYRTGDLARRIEGGQLAFVGRIDEQLKIDGYRVEPGEVEHWARELSGTSVVAVGARGDGGALELHLVLEGRAGGSPELLARLRARLPAYMMPSAVHVWDALPLTAHGKVDRREVERRLGARSRG